MARSREASFAALVIFLALVAGAAAFGGMFGQGEWYENLTKPELNPPRWVFGPVWTVLYLMMAIAAWLVWKAAGSLRRAAMPLGFWLLQLLFNALWSWIFFGLHELTLAAVEIVILDLLILSTVVLFYRVRPVAAWLLLPYLAWVAFASYLTFAIRTLNS